jgi:hypothetical protein
MRCTICRRDDALATWQEKIARWLVSHIFPNTLKDERSEASTRGFVDGYSMGIGHGKELKEQENLINSLRNKDDIYRA